MKNLWLALLALAALVAWSTMARAERLRDMTEIAGVRDNQLVGFGLVTGLGGTGDDTSVPFAQQAVLSMLRRLGLQVDSTQIRLRNVAAVTVTATLPPFAKTGTKIDVTVSSIGNARSLSGGVLIQTVLKGADQRPYAVAQGGLLVGGFQAKGSSGSSVQSGSPTTARIPAGALVEREITVPVVASGVIRLELRDPGFTVASRVVEAVNDKFVGAATAIDGGSIDIHLPREYESRIVDFVAEIEDIEVVPLHRARVVINERTGTIVAGGDVRLSAAAIVHGSLTIVVKESPTPSQPTTPFGGGSTVVAPKTDIEATEPRRTMKYVPAAPTLSDVATTLGTLGLSPRELASVLQALREAGALEAEVVVE
ncbi:MAG: flagellar basal body P-ring protein FlgI [Polyangiaceae bacterium]|jgi:flagellar P-ring protein precursor FlgI